MSITRRRFLAGLGGAAVALPVLESVKFLGSSRARAAADAAPVYSVFVRQGNGVAQAWADEPERFWPRNLGALTADVLATENADRAVSVLAPYADRLLMVRGTRYPFPGAGCGHSGGINQCLTAATVQGEGATSLASGPSVDWLIAQHCNPPGVEPLALMSGPQDAYIAFGLSYSGAGQLRGAQNNPFAAYQGMMGLDGASTEVLEAIAARRTSVNDLVRGEMQDLMSRSYLSSADKLRLQTHFDSIRDFEVRMCNSLDTAVVDRMEDMSQSFEQNDNRIVVAELQMDLIALAFACDVNRTATLQIGTGNDQTRYYVDGVLQNTFHRISHRIDSDGSSGDPIPNADVLHSKIDLLFAGMFKYLLDRLDSYPGPGGGTLLDDSVALWTNDLANGPPHSYDNIPQILAGGAAGFLKTGQYIDAGDVGHNKLLNTIISAVGIKGDDGGHYRTFGDSSLDGGVIPAMIA
jgi:hypothetical protein